MNFWKLKEDDSSSSLFSLSEFNLYFVYIWVFLNIILFFSLRWIHKSQNFVYSLDYLFCLISICSVFCWIFLCNNLYTLIFLIEIASYLIFFKLTLIKQFNSRIFSFPAKRAVYFDLLFFHYWTSFFSLVSLLIFLLILSYIYGSVRDGITLFLGNNLNTGLEEFFFYVYTYLFIIAFFLKLGVSPFHFFKILMYRGLPHQYMFYYTTVYLIGFFLVFTSIYLKFFVAIPFFIPLFFLSIFTLIIGFFLTQVFNNFSVSTFVILSTIYNLVNFTLILICLIM